MYCIPFELRIDFFRLIQHIISDYFYHINKKKYYEDLTRFI